MLCPHNFEGFGMGASALRYERPIVYGFVDIYFCGGVLPPLNSAENGGIGRSSGSSSPSPFPWGGRHPDWRKLF